MAVDARSNAMPQPEIRRYMKHGTLPQLRVFEASARLGSLTRAAQELRIAQGTASVQIKKLSETVGIALFEQVGRRMQLTEAGQWLYDNCVEVFRILADMEATLAGMRGLASGRLRLAVPPAAALFASRLTETFARRNPGVQVSLQACSRLARIQRLANGEDDLWMFVEPPDEVIAQALVPNPLVVLAGRDHALARESDIPFARLANEPFLMRESGSETRMIILRLFARHGLAPKIHMELGSDEAIREALVAGLGVAILPRYTLGLDPVLRKLVCLDVEGFPLESHWHLVYPVGKRLSAATRCFMDFARAEAKSLFRDCLRERCFAAHPSASSALAG
jgi:LysR family transcriptional regulator, low CO2-responsive transcriptional regulator